MLYFLYFLLGFFIFFCGCCIGSFLNVVIYRLPLHISVAKGRSFCPSCKRNLRAAELVPLFSFLCLRGRCKGCREKISPRYPVVEAMMGLAALLIFCRGGFSAWSFIAFAAAALLLTIAFIDKDTMEIPNILVLLLLVPAILMLFFSPETTLLSHLIGLVVISLPMFLLTLAIPDCFGGGDIKLMAVCGLMLGWQGALLATFIALLWGGIYGIYLLRLNKENRKAHFAFGPCLCLGVFISLLYAKDLIGWYLHIFGL